ncbi:hypothetical protein M0C34_18940 [Agarivorans sp. TSD2052]|uniref:hypothetical protein n=1 Tax=Agarivorans sp. TSD2052 TaxID=2937286 RepID=UPI00200E8379|nr:hypothetical protein [Agarivorans sp. TSD2052]UPW18274.1 hypothetical protein M0C34_18940 [Agarivorans sp. TSD2052]
MKLSINFADDKFEAFRKWNTYTAKNKGKVDKVFEFKKEDMDDDFVENNSEVLNRKRGAGYWLWKPYFIKKVMDSANDGDYIMYCDSGTIFINSVDLLIDVMDEDGKSVMLFELPLIERQWTNNYLFNFMGLETSEYKDSNQILASYMLFKKTPYSVFFVNEYLNLCRKKELVTDDMTTESEEAFDHRHDQSILSLLAKKNGLIPYRDPSDYGEFPSQYFSMNRLFRVNDRRSKYPTILLSNRKANPIKYYFKFRIKALLRKVIGNGF